MSTRRQLAGWTLLGIALRFLLLPATAHADLLTIYDRVRVWRTGAFRLEDFHLQALPMFLHRAWASLGIPLPDLSAIDYPGTVASYEHGCAAALAPDAALWWVALWKLPYLAFDVACGLVLTRLVAREHRPFLWRAWMLNPIVIYVGAMFGRYDALMLLPLLLGLLALQRGRDGWGFVGLGLAGAMRIYPFLLLLPMALASASDTRGRLERLLAGAAPLGAMLAVLALGGGIAWVLVPAALYALARAQVRLRGTRGEIVLWAAVIAGFSAVVPRILARMEDPIYPAGRILHHVQYLQRIGIGLREDDSVLLFFVAYGAACIWAHLRSVERTATVTRSPSDDAIRAGTLSALAFFSFAHFHPQYALLLIPLALLAVPQARDGRAALGLQTVGLALYLLIDKSGIFSIKLFLPLAPAEILRVIPYADSISLLSPENGLEWRSIGRTLLVAGSAWMAWDLVADRRPTGRPRGALIARCAMVTWPLLLLALCTLFLTEPTRMAVGPEMQVATIAGGIPPELKFAAGETPPDALEIVMPDAATLMRNRGLRAELARSTTGETFSTWIPEADIRPDRTGRSILELSAFDLEPGESYRLTLEREEQGSTPPTSITPLGPLEAPLAAVAKSARARIASSPAFAWAWLGGAGAALLAGALLLVPRRRPQIAPSTAR